MFEFMKKLFPEPEPNTLEIDLAKIDNVQDLIMLLQETSQISRKVIIRENDKLMPKFKHLLKV